MKRALGELEPNHMDCPPFPNLVRSDPSPSRATLTSFRFRRLAQFRHGLRGSERRPS